MGSDEVLGLVGVSVWSLAGVLVALGVLILDETGVEALAVLAELTELRAPVH